MPLTTCPECEMPMEVKNFEDVLIDTCPSCRGVWLDRGELQKIIAHVRNQEAENPSAIPTAAAPPPRDSRSRDRDHRDHRDHRDDRDHRDHRDHRDDRSRGKGKKKRKKRFGLWDVLEELID
ncbi:MAG: zf-TFIIB domain-containing protein [Planctomycetota bacterium]